MSLESELGLHVGPIGGTYMCNGSFTVIFDRYHYPATTIQYYLYYHDY